MVFLSNERRTIIARGVLMRSVPVLCQCVHVRGLSQKVVDFLNSKKSVRAIMFIFCRTIGLSFLNILSVLIDKKIIGIIFMLILSR